MLITGCSGFVGRLLAEACLAEGWTVRGSIRAHCYQACLPAGVAPVVIPDIGPGADWTEALKRVDTVVHLAALVHRGRNEEAGPMVETAHFRANTSGTARLARAAAEAGVKRLVFLSTLLVNSENRAEACREADREAPCGAYAMSKFEAEKALREILGETGLQTVILRPPLVYGPGVRANFLRLLRLVGRGFHLPFKDVKNRRSLIYVGNLVNVIMVCLTHANNAAAKTYLVADRETISIPDLVRELAGLLGVKTRLFSCPMPLLSAAAQIVGRGQDLRRLTDSLWADTSKIRQELGWRPKFSLREGMAATVSWYRATRAG